MHDTVLYELSEPGKTGTCCNVNTHYINYNTEEKSMNNMILINKIREFLINKLYYGKSDKIKKDSTETNKQGKTIKTRVHNDSELYLNRSSISL